MGVGTRDTGASRQHDRTACLACAVCLACPSPAAAVLLVERLAGGPLPVRLWSQEAQRTPTALAVAACVARGRSDAGLASDQHRLLDQEADLLALAPNDEILAELLALQVTVAGGRPRRGRPSGVG